MAVSVRRSICFQENNIRPVLQDERLAGRVVRASSSASCAMTKRRRVREMLKHESRALRPGSFRQNRYRSRLDRPTQSQHTGAGHRTELLRQWQGG